jgi:2-C-methyl-D-erythritol 4-phosphate cytidylyltransferase/2-C-methyl-D-erythritol 2,4-cyclodiphosphate synthase
MNTNGAAIIPAAGSGSRMKTSCPKQYLDLAGKPVLIHTVSAFHHNEGIQQIVVVVPSDRVESTRELLRTWQLNSKTEVVAGGKRRQDSVKAGLDALDSSIDTVLVHDGARPLVTNELINRCHVSASKHGAAIAAIRVKDTLKKCSPDSSIEKTIDRTNLWQAQTPQAARLPLLRSAFDKVGDNDVTDEASLLEAAGITVKIVEGSETNIKITRPEDLIIANKIIMQPSADQIRVGHGFDAHRLAEGRALILGGVKIEHPLGLEGHSDADVVTHALCDALLGALGKGDIGIHFPDSAAEFKNIYSILLLERVTAQMKTEGYTIGNADITIVCQSPKLAPHLDKMKEIISKACNTNKQRINIKATTTEKMGYTGRQEGISSHAVVFLTKSELENTQC